MKTYHFDVPVACAEGTQTFAVEAESPEEAMRKLRNGGGEIIAQEIEVQDLDWNGAQLVDET
jgi:hypothetical protein